MSPTQDSSEALPAQQPRLQADECSQTNTALLELLKQTSQSAQHIRAELLALRMAKVVSEQSRVLEHSSSKRSSVDNASRTLQPSPRDSAGTDKKDAAVSPLTRSPAGQLEKSFKRLFGDRVSQSGERRASPRQPEQIHEALSDMLAQVFQDTDAALKPREQAGGDSRTVTIHCTVPDKLPSPSETSETVEHAAADQLEASQTVADSAECPGAQIEDLPAGQPRAQEAPAAIIDSKPHEQEADWSGVDVDHPRLGSEFDCVLMSPRTTRDADTPEPGYTHDPPAAFVGGATHLLHATPSRISQLQQAGGLTASQQTSECVLMGSPLPYAEDQEGVTSHPSATTPEAQASITPREHMGSSTKGDYQLLLKAGRQPVVPKRTHVKLELSKTPTRTPAVPAAAAAASKTTAVTPASPGRLAITSKVPAARPRAGSNLSAVPIGMAPVQKARLPPPPVLSPRDIPKPVTKMDMLAKLQKVNEAFNNNRKRSTGSGGRTTKSSANSAKGVSTGPVLVTDKPAVPRLKAMPDRLLKPVATPSGRVTATASPRPGVGVSPRPGVGVSPRPGVVASPRTGVAASPRTGVAASPRAGAAPSPRKVQAAAPSKPSNLYKQLLSQTAHSGRRSTAADAAKAGGTKAKPGFLSARSGGGTSRVSERAGQQGRADAQQGQEGRDRAAGAQGQPVHGFVIVSRRNTQEQLVQGVRAPTPTPLDTLDVPEAGGRSPVSLAIPTSPTMMYGGTLPVQAVPDHVSDRYQARGAHVGTDWDVMAVPHGHVEGGMLHPYQHDDTTLHSELSEPPQPHPQAARTAAAAIPTRPAAGGRAIGLRTTPTIPPAIKPPAQSARQQQQLQSKPVAYDAPLPRKPALPFTTRHRRTKSGPQQDPFASPEVHAAAPKASWVVRELDSMPAGAPGASPWLGHELITSADMIHMAGHHPMSPVFHKLPPATDATPPAQPSTKAHHHQAPGDADKHPPGASANTALVKLKLAGGVLRDDSAAASPGTRMRNYAYAAASLLAGKPVERGVMGSQSARTAGTYRPPLKHTGGGNVSAGASMFPSNTNTPTVLSPRVPDDLEPEYSSISVHPVLLSHPAGVTKPYELISRSQSMARPSGSTSCSRFPSTRPTHEDLPLSEMSVIIKKTPLGKDRSSSSLVGMFGDDPSHARSIRRTGPSRITPARPRPAVQQPGQMVANPGANRSPNSRGTTQSHGGAVPSSVDGSVAGVSAAVPRYAVATAASAARTSPSPPAVPQYSKPSPGVTPSKSSTHKAGAAGGAQVSRTPSPVPYRTYSGALDVADQDDMAGHVRTTPGRSHRQSPGPTDSVINLTAAVEEEERSLAALLAGQLPPSPPPAAALPPAADTPLVAGTPTKQLAAPAAAATAPAPVPSVWDPFTSGEAATAFAGATQQAQAAAVEQAVKLAGRIQGDERQGEESSGGVSVQGSAPSATGLCDSLASSVTMRMLPSNGGTERSSDRGGPTTTSLPLPPVLHTAPAVLSHTPGAASPREARRSLDLPGIGAPDAAVLANPRIATEHKATSPVRGGEHMELLHCTRAVGVNTSPSLIGSPCSRAQSRAPTTDDAAAAALPVMVSHEQVVLCPGIAAVRSPQSSTAALPGDSNSNAAEITFPAVSRDTGSSIEAPVFLHAAAGTAIHGCSDLTFPTVVHQAASNHVAQEIKPCDATTSPASVVVAVEDGAPVAVAVGLEDSAPAGDTAADSKGSASVLLPVTDVQEGCIVGMTHLGQQLLAHLPAETSTRDVVVALTQGVDAVLPELPALTPGKAASDWSHNPACTCTNCMGSGCLNLGKTRGMLAAFKRVALPGTCTARVEVDHDQQVKLHLDAGCTKHWEMLVNGFGCSRDDWQPGASSVRLTGWAAGQPCELKLVMTSAASHAYLVLGLNTIMQMIRVQKESGPGVALDTRAMELHAAAHACMPMKLTTWGADVA